MRMSRGSYIVCALNFTPVRYDNFTIGLPKPGVLREMINSDDTKYSGSGVLNESEIRSHKKSFLDFAYSAEITLPPMSCVYFRFTPSKPAPKRKKPSAPAKKPRKQAR